MALILKLEDCQMRRREFIGGLGSIAAWPLAVHAQQRAQIKRIAYISPGTLLTPIKRELAKLGWIEGDNIHIGALIALDRRGLLAAAPFVVSSTPDLIVVIGTEPAQIFKEATDTIPVLFAFVADPIASNLVKSFGRPGGNLTGFTNVPQPSLTGRWLSLLKGLVPRIDRVMMLHDPANAILLSGLQDAASALHVTIHSGPATAIAEAEREIETFARDAGGGMIVVPYALTAVEQATIVALAARHRLPTIYGSKVFVGGLMSYAPVEYDIFPGVARYADSILMRETRRSSGSRADQVPAAHQSEDCKGARPYHSPEPARARRRGDRMTAGVHCGAWQRGGLADCSARQKGDRIRSASCCLAEFRASCKISGDRL
jgi:putative tryptophan/tyrosine transport system substrate-binding protein